MAEGLLRVGGERPGAHHRLHAALQQTELQRSATPTRSLTLRAGLLRAENTLWFHKWHDLSRNSLCKALCNRQM